MEDDEVCLFYDPFFNRFFDENGELVENVLEHVTPNELFLFKRTGLSHTVPHRHMRGRFVTLYQPEPDDCSYCDFYRCCPESPWGDGYECSNCEHEAVCPRAPRFPCGGYLEGGEIE